MTPAERRRRAKEIFGDACELEADARTAFLEEHCGADAKLRSEVDGLFAAIEGAGAFLSDPTRGREHATATRPGGTVADPAHAEPGSCIGPYRLVRVIGEGGFGVVYLAEQERPLRRQVAIKVVKLGMDTRRVIARFEAERQALAMTDHPGIATVLDAGATAAGRPYFVMEYVPGETITEYCRRRRLTLEQRLDLFDDVCSAVQHAHQKGIIHRDIKPNNVLVAHADGAPRPKVIDFGIAKLTEGRLTDHTIITEERQLLGTPAYMAPEQATLGAVDVDTRADIYSLGVLLYELIVGVPPFDHDVLRDASLDEFRRILREEHPLRPSARLIAMGDAEHTVARERRTEVWRLRRAVQGDLDWIVMKALEKDRGRRYPTAYALAADLRRYRADEPVDAGPPGPLYRAVKMVQRHRTATAVLSLTLFTLVTATTVSLGFAAAALDARDEARRLQHRAEELADARDAARSEAERKAYNAAMQAAASAVRLNDGTSARRHLDAAPVELRGWEWRYIDNRLGGSVATLRYGGALCRTVDAHPASGAIISSWDDGFVRAHDAATAEETWSVELGERPVIAYAPGGATLVASSQSGRVALLDARSGTVLIEFRPHDERVGRPAFAPDGRRFVTASEDGAAVIRSLDAREPLRTLEHASPLTLVEWSPAGDRIATASFDHRVRLWEPDTGRTVATFTATRPATPIEAPTRWAQATPRVFRFSPDGAWLAVGGTDGSLHLRIADTGELRHDLSDALGSRVIRDIAFSPDGARLAVASRSGRIAVFDPATGTQLLLMDAHPDDTRALQFMADGRSLVSCAWDHGVAIHDSITGERTHSFVGHTALVFDFAVTANDRHIVSFAADGTMRIWSLDRVGRSALPRHPRWCADVVYIDDERLATASPLDRPRIMHARENVLVEVDAIPDSGNTLAYCPLGDLLACGGRSGRVHLFRPDGTVVRAFDAHDGDARAVAFSPDGTQLATAGDDAAVRLWRVDDGSPLAQLPCATGSTHAVAWTHDGSRILSVGSEGSLTMSPVDGGASTVIPLGHGDCRGLAVDPAGRTVAVAAGRVIVLVDLDSARVTRVLPGHSREVRAVAWLPDRSRIVSGGADRTVRLWDPETGDEVLMLDGHEKIVRTVEVSPNGDAIASGGEDGLLRIWRASPPR